MNATAAYPLVGVDVYHFGEGRVDNDLDNDGDCRKDDGHDQVAQQLARLEGLVCDCDTVEDAVDAVVFDCEGSSKGCGERTSHR